MMRRLAGYILIASIIVSGLIAALASMPWPRAPLPPREGPSLADAWSWAYQLQHLEPELISPEFDLLVVDYSRDGTAAGAWTTEKVAAMRHRPGRKPRIVLAYLSIGEAESYRPYWRAHWRIRRPAWLGQENAEWPGNFAVRYWDPGWASLHFDAEPTLLRRVLPGLLPGLYTEPLLDRILDAGFDGVFLDKVDAFEDWESERPSAADDMSGLVRAISAYARMRRPGFLIVPQNGEALLSRKDYLAAIDGIAKEDLTHGIGGDGVPNSPDEVEEAVQSLKLAAEAGLPVFQVEYLDDPAVRQVVQASSTRLDFRLLFAARELNAPSEPLLRGEGIGRGER